MTAKTTTTEVDKEHVQDLKRSQRLIGEIDAVIKDQKGRIIAGRHRAAAGWKSERTVRTKDDLDFYVKSLHATVQRHSSQEEQASMFRAICREVAKLGKVPKEKVARYVLENISPFEKSYTLELIPDEFKQQSKQRFFFGDDGVEDRRSRTWTINGVTFQKKTLAEMSKEALVLKEEAPKRERECPACRAPLLVTDDYLLILNLAAASS